MTTLEQSEGGAVSLYFQQTSSSTFNVGFNQVLDHPNEILTQISTEFVKCRDKMSAEVNLATAQSNVIQQQEETSLRMKNE